MVQNAEQIAAERGITAKSARAIAKTQREERRARVAELLMQHHTYIEIAGKLGCSPGTVANDVTVIRHGWRDRAGEAYDALVAEEDAKLDALERVVLPKAWYGGENGDGSLWAVDRALAIQDRRARLHGLDRPVQQKLAVNVTSETPTDVAIRELLDQAAAADAAKPA